MTKVAPSAKATPLPELRSRCKLTQRILSEPCPEFEEIQRIIGRRETNLANVTASAVYAEEAKAKQEKALNVWYHDNSIENFKLFVKANAEHDAAQSAYKCTIPISSASMSEWMKGDDIREATMAGLRVIQKRLAKKISELNDEEAKRMVEAGLDPGGEHPSITGLKNHLQAVAGAIINLQNGNTFNWNEYSNLFQS